MFDPRALLRDLGHLFLPTRVLLAYGRAPLAFYIAHFYLITSTSVVLVAAFGLEGVPLPFVVIIFVDASAYFLSQGVATDRAQTHSPSRDLRNAIALIAHT
jgi:hypothetical protein